jgi:hypothetical protein
MDRSAHGSSFRWFDVMDTVQCRDSSTLHTQRGNSPIGQIIDPQIKGIHFMSDNPYSSPMGTPGSPISKPGFEGGLALNTVEPLVQVAGWLKFLGILNIIAGVIYCLTIVGIIFGWLPIWIGVTLNKASNSLQTGYANRSQLVLRNGMESLALVVKIFGVLAVIGLVINVLYFGAIILAVVGGAVSSQM